MTEFEDRLTDYLVKLKQNKLIYSMINAKEEKSKRALLFPKNEEELEAAIDYYTYLDDVTHLIFDVRFGDVKPVPAEENAAFALCINIINTLKNKQSTVPIPNDDRYLAKLMYDCVVGFFLDESKQKETIRYISEQTGFDLNNAKEAELFNYYLEQAKVMIPSSPDDTPEKTNSKIGKYFHELYINGKKTEEDNELEKAIARLLINL